MAPESEMFLIISSRRKGNRETSTKGNGRNAEVLRGLVYPEPESCGWLGVFFFFVENFTKNTTRSHLGVDLFGTKNVQA